MNRLVLSAQVLERGALRYTPAGLPARDLVLKHQSEVEQDGPPRKISIEVKALAIGAIGARIDTLGLDGQATFAGFVAAGRNGRGWVFHITEFEPVQENQHAPTTR